MGIPYTKAKKWWANPPNCVFYRIDPRNWAERCLNEKVIDIVREDVIRPSVDCVNCEHKQGVKI